MKRSSGGTKKLKTDEGDPSSHPEEAGDQVEAGGNEQDKEGGGTKDGPGSSDPPTSSTSVVAAAGTGNANPLENSVILSHLFKLCPAKTLANCRLVSKQWYQESLLTYRSDFPITLKMKEIFLSNRPSAGNLPTKIVYCLTQFQDFAEYCLNPKNDCARKPYRNLTIQQWIFDEDPEQFQQFWRAIGSKLTTLLLSSCTFNSVEEFRTIMFVACPHLQTLKLDHCKLSSGIGRAPAVELMEYEEPLFGKRVELKSLQISHSPLPVSWLEIFSHFQSLTNLSVLRWKSEFDPLTNAIQILRRKDPKALPIKLFKIHQAPDIAQCDLLSQTRLKILQELRLPLVSLDIDVQHEEMDTELMKATLESYANTVEEITVTRNAPVALVPPFPFGIRLDNLTTLNIEEYCGNVFFPSLRLTPNLKQLHIYGFEGLTRIWLESCTLEMAGNVRLAHLVELKLFGKMLPLSDQDLASLIEWMPNLTSLEMKLDDRQFRMVCGGWKNLESLRVSGRKLSDAGVTGLGALGGSEATRPNIADLTKLKKFHYYFHLTDVSVFHGFLKLPHLEELYYCLPERWGKKGEAMKALEKRKIRFGIGK